MGDTTVVIFGKYSLPQLFTYNQWAIKLPNACAQTGQVLHTLKSFPLSFETTSASDALLHKYSGLSRFFEHQSFRLFFYKSSPILCSIPSGSLFLLGNHE